MGPRDHDEHSERHESDAQPGREGRGTPRSGAAGPQVIETNDPSIAAGPAYRSQWERHPDANMIIETSRIREPDEARNPTLVMVPVEYAPTDRGRDQDGDANDKGGGEGRGDHAHARKRDARDENQRAKDEKQDERKEARRDDRGDRHEDHDGEDRGRPAQGPSLTRVLLYSGVVALICGVVGAWGYSYFFGPSKSEDQGSSDQQASAKKSSAGSSKKGQGSKSGSESGGKADSAKEIPGFTRADDADTLRKQNEHLAERIDRLSARIDTLSKPRDQTPPDVRTLQNKVGELAKTVEEMNDLPARYRRLQDRVEDLRQQLKTLRSALPAREGGDEESTAPPAMTPRLPGPAPDRGPAVKPLGRAEGDAPFRLADAPDAALEQAIELFSARRYREADNILRKLQLTEPGDARVWYYSALARGFVTGRWGAETEDLVKRGAERERAGQPSARDVDTALAGLDRAQGGDWLDAFRRRFGARR